MECYCFLRNVQDHLADGKTPDERRFGIPFNGPVIPFGAMVEYHPIYAKESRLHKFGKFYLEYSSDMHCSRRSLKGDILVADFDELENLDV